MDNGKNVAKNVLLLSLSKYSGLRKFVYVLQDNDNPIRVTGSYQLDPVPRMLFKKLGVKLDKIIMLYTPETTEKNKTGQTALSVFKRHNRSFVVDKDAFFPVSINVDDPADALNTVVSEIRSINETYGINLYMDTHGGLRGVERVLEAVVSLLQDEGITPKAIYGIEMQQEKYNPRTNPNKIIKEDKRFKIFEFVSGMNEFFNSGKLGELKQFLEPGDALTRGIEKVSDGIQWCNIYQFEEGLADLGLYFESKNNPPEKMDSYMKIFSERIYEDYGVLLKKHNVSDEIDWCKRKGFYQQALTLIESKISYELYEKELIIIDKTEYPETPATNHLQEIGKTFFILNKDPDETLGHKQYKTDLNELWNSYCFTFDDRNNRLGNTYSILNGVISHLNKKASPPPTFSFVKTKNETWPISQKNGVDLKELIKRHKIIKKYRNNANHGNKFDDTIDIVTIINEYLDEMDHLTKQVKK